MTFTHEHASKNIIRFATEGRLIQQAWHQDRDGREMACLLGSIDPSVQGAADCNGDLMPMWLATITPTLFDGIPREHVTEIGLRYGNLVGRWHVLKPENWEAVLIRFLCRTVDDAVESARPVAEKLSVWPRVVDAARLTVEALKLPAEDPQRQEKGAAAYAAADAAARAAARAAAFAATYAAAFAATYAAARAAADAAARAAADAAADAAAFAATYAAAGAAARAAAYLRLFTFLLDQIEQEVVKCETAG
jgi:hypothetical protein